MDNISNIKKSKIRIFPFQTKDAAFILYPDLPSSYLLSLLIERCGFLLSQFEYEYVYPTQKCNNKILENLPNYSEKYFIFYLENYYHSSDYALGFVENILDKLVELKKDTFVIIHTTKTPHEEIVSLINSYENILLVVTGDFEDFFHQFFEKSKKINDIPNIYFRDDNQKVIVNSNMKVESSLDDFILPAYANRYYTSFAKSKDAIVSILDDDTKATDNSSYYKRSQSTLIGTFRNLPETEIMLTSGRGCRYRCSYCFRGVKYSTVRQISLETLKKDLDYLEHLQYKYIYFYDDCFVTTNFNRLDEIIILLNQYGFEYGLAARFEICTSKNLLKLSTLNIKRIQVGLQSVSIEVNKETNRGFNKENFGKTMNQMRDMGIHISLDIILGLPGEGVRGFIQTFNYALSLNPQSIFINSLFLNPGTELYSKKESYGIVTKQSGVQDLFHVNSMESSNDFSSNDILIARKYVSYYIRKVENINIILR